MGKILNTINWKRYLDVTNGNPQVERFLESRGNDVFWQIAQNIHKSGNGGKHTKDKLVMLIHENAPNAIFIEKKDYIEVLDLCLNWFEKKEWYERCSEIVKFKESIKNNTQVNININKEAPKKQSKLI